jgi:DNA-binding NarL/FixJ family response regulator
MPDTARIAVIEHHSLLRRGLESLLPGLPAARLVAVLAEPEELYAAGPADVVLLGPAPEAEGTLEEVVGELAALGRVLVVAEFALSGSVTAALRAGAHGCVSRQADETELLTAVATVADGGVHVSPELAERLHRELRQPQAGAPPALARREIETLRWLAAGLTHRQIARRMALTEATVSTYVKRIRNKLGVGNKADLTRKAFELGLFPEDDRPPSSDGEDAAGHRVTSPAA